MSKGGFAFDPIFDGLRLSGKRKSKQETMIRNALLNVLYHWFPSPQRPGLNDLAAIPFVQWISVRNLGKKSLALIRSRLAEHGLDIVVPGSKGSAVAAECEPWPGPPGCECDLGLPPSERCTKGGMIRCNGALAAQQAQHEKRRAERSQTSAVVAPATPPAQADATKGARGPEGATLTERARKLFRPPFRFEMGYVWDSAGEMVADNREDKEDAAALPALRVRGWGRIGYLPEPEALHGEAGRLIAEALTKGWPSTGRSNG